MEGFTELRKIHYTYGYDLSHQKDRLKSSTGRGTQGRDLELPSMTSYLSSPCGLVWMATQFFFLQQHLKIHVEYCQQGKISPAVVPQIFIRTWLYTCEWQPAWVTLVSSPFRGWVDKCSEAFTTNHIINIGNLHVPKPPGKQSYPCWARDIPRA